jgi:hypothetical protein
MTFVPWNQQVKTPAMKAPAQSLAYRVRLWGSHRRPQSTNIQMRQTCVDVRSEDAVAIVNEEAMG